MNMAINYKLPFPDGVPGIGFRANYMRNENDIFTLEMNDIFTLEIYDPAVRSKYLLFTMYQVASSCALILGAAELVQRL